jgi:hypothetical protein
MISIDIRNGDPVPNLNVSVDLHGPEARRTELFGDRQSGSHTQQLGTQQ